MVAKQHNLWHSLLKSFSSKSSSLSGKNKTMSLKNDNIQTEIKLQAYLGDIAGLVPDHQNKAYQMIFFVCHCIEKSCLKDSKKS